MHCANFPNTSKLHNYRISVPQMTTDMFCFSNQYPVFSSFMTYHQFCSKSNMVESTRGAGTSLVHHPFLVGSCCSIFSLLFVFLTFFLWPLCCLTFFGLPCTNEQ